MRYRNSINFTLRNSKSGKSNQNSKYNETNPYSDKVLKNFFLNNLNRMSRKNIDLIKNLNNTFRHYELNIDQKDIKIAKNLFNISVNRVTNIKNKIKLSEQLFRQYDKKYGFYYANNFSSPDLLNESREKKEKIKVKNNISIDMDENKSDILYEENKNDNISNTNEKGGNGKDFKRYSINYNGKNNIKKYMKIIVNEKKIEKKVKKVEQLAKLFNAVETVEKKEIIEENKFFKIDSNKIKFIPFYRNNKNKIKKKIDFNYLNSRCRIRKNKNKFLSEEKLMRNGTFVTFSQIKSESNIKDITNNHSNTFYNNKIKNNKEGKKNELTPKIILSTPNNKSITKTNSNITSLKDLHTENTSSHISNIQSAISRNKKNIVISSSSFPNLQLNYSPIPKKKIKFLLKTTQKNKEMRPMIHKTINEGKKINKIIEKNYNKHKEPRIKDNFLEILEDKKLNLEKLRNELKLKDSNGIYGSIDEIEIMENNNKKLEKHITKKQMNFLKSIVKGIIKEDSLLNKRLVYNVGIENRINRQKYLELYNILTNSKFKKRKIEDNYIYS